MNESKLKFSIFEKDTAIRSLCFFFLDGWETLASDEELDWEEAFVRRTPVLFRILIFKFHLFLVICHAVVEVRELFGVFCLDQGFEDLLLLCDKLRDPVLVQVDLDADEARHHEFFEFEVSSDVNSFKCFDPKPINLQIRQILQYNILVVIVSAVILLSIFELLFD